VPATVAEETLLELEQELRSLSRSNIPNRYYDPATSQFLTVDPMQAATESPYGYVNDSPMNGADATGLFWGEGVLKKAAHVAGAVASTAWRDRTTILAVGGMAACTLGSAGTLAAACTAVGVALLTNDVGTHAYRYATGRESGWQALEYGGLEAGLDVGGLYLGAPGTPAEVLGSLRMGRWILGQRPDIPYLFRLFGSGGPWLGGTEIEGFGSERQPDGGTLTSQAACGVGGFYV
jgi:RHS repeat-associated protein